MTAQKQLSPEQKYTINQVVATLRIENMEPPQDLINELQKITTGGKTIEQSIKELNTRYQR